MILLLVLLIILLPLPAFAFGPFAHVDMGLAVLAQASAIGTVTASIIQRHRKAFLRGTVDPDRMLAKNMAPFEHHTHNWDRVLICLTTLLPTKKRPPLWASFAIWPLMLWPTITLCPPK